MKDVALGDSYGAVAVDVDDVAVGVAAAVDALGNFADNIGTDRGFGVAAAVAAAVDAIDVEVDDVPSHSLFDNDPGQ